MNKLPLHDEAMALLAIADAATSGSASTDSFVETALLSGTPADVIAELYEFADEQQIELPRIEDLVA